MSGYRHIICVIVSILLLNASNLFAKVYWLPDYLGDNTNRSNGLEDNPQNGVVDKERGCPNGWLDAAQKGDMICDLMGNYPWVGYCYSNCKCNPDKYLYTEENCSGTKAPTGSSCDDGSGTIYYNQCIDACDTVEGVTNCPYGCKTTFEAEGCPTECKECYTDNCHNRTSVEPCDYGCESYFSDCSSKCEKCYADNCRNRTDNATDLGCDSYWQDCASKCEVGKTCVPTDCSAYTLTSCPANATCTNCTIGCGDSSVKYKLTKCNPGYEWNDTFCIACDFEWSGHVLSSCPSNGNCTSMICGGLTKYKLSSCKSGYTQSGNTCVACDFSGYTLTSCPSNGTCTSKTCGGSTKYKLSSCSSGYEVSGSSCVVCDFSGYTLSSCPTNGNCTNKSCSGTTKYKLSSCKSGYTQSGNSCEACTWGGYTLTSCPSNGTCASSTCGGTIKYSLSSCKSNYYKNGNTCLACDFSGYTLTSCPTNGTCTNKTCGGSTKYSLSGCVSGYEPNANGSVCDKAVKGAVKLTYEVAAGGRIVIYLVANDGAGTIYWGDGSSSEVNSLTILKDHTYSTAGNYQVTIKGDINSIDEIRVTNAYLLSFDQLNLETLRQLGSGVVITNSSLVIDCSKATGTIPELPVGLVIGVGIFNSCSGLTGNIPELPTGLTDGRAMFKNCSNLTGNVPNLPSTLTGATYMFSGCSNLTGYTPPKPTSLTSDSFVFSDTQVTNDGSWSNMAFW